MTNDQVFVPKCRSQLGLPPLDPSQEDTFGSQVSEKVKNELLEAIGDSPIGAVMTSASYLACFF
jgi:omega-6 fatty acid desaturase (delta-12 desaturase)